MELNYCGVNSKSRGILKICVLAIFLLPWNAWSSFYQAETLANYCKEYIKMVSLETSVNQLEAGICSGYTASKIEVMDLSGQLCQRNQVNLDEVVKDYIEQVASNKDLLNKSATYVMVDLLERKYACTNDA